MKAGLHILPLWANRCDPLPLLLFHSWPSRECSLRPFSLLVQVLSQPAHQNVLIALDDARVVHVKKFGEQAHAEGTNSAEGPAGEPDDAACNFWDAPASLADAEQEGEEDAWRQNMMAGGQHKIGGDAQRGMLQERAERGAAQAATVSASAGASPTTAGKSVPVIKQRDPLKADLGNDKQGVAKPQMLLDKEPQPGANVPVVSSGAVRWLSGVPAEGGCTRQASKGDLRKDAAEAAGRVKQPNTTPGAGPPVAEMNGVAGSQTAASGLDPAAPGGGSVAWVSSGGGCGQEEGEKDAEEEELGKLKHCQASDWNCEDKLLRRGHDSSSFEFWDRPPISLRMCL